MKTLSKLYQQSTSFQQESYLDISLALVPGLTTCNVGLDPLIGQFPSKVFTSILCSCDQIFYSVLQPDIIPTHWSVIVGEDSLMVSGSLKRSLEIFNIYIHPEYKPNAPTYSFPSDFDVGKSKDFFQLLSEIANHMT